MEAEPPYPPVGSGQFPLPMRQVGWVRSRFPSLRSPRLPLSPVRFGPGTSLAVRSQTNGER
jgi:hypothetical protein